MENLGLYVLLSVIAFAVGVFIYCLAYDSGYYDGYCHCNAKSPYDFDLPSLSPQQEEDATDWGDPANYPYQDHIVFGRYCLMEHQPWNSQEYAVYPYDSMHVLTNPNDLGPHFYFKHREDALEYMDIYDERAAQFQRRDNLLHDLEADFGITKSEKNLDDWTWLDDDAEESLS